MISSEGKVATREQSDLRYPITYRVVTWVRMVVALGGLGAGLAWTYITIFPAYAHGSMVFSAVPIAIDLLLLAGLAYGFAWAMTAHITLYADRFEQRKPFIRRVLRLEDIAGRRFTTGRGAGYPVIIPKSGVAFSIDSTSYGLDERFTRWFMQLADVDELARAKERERIRRDSSLGASPDERLAANASRRQNFVIVGSLLGLAAFVMFFISMSSRDHLPWLLAINALLPWATFLLLAIYRDQITGPDGGKFFFVTPAVLAPVGSLGILAAENARVIHASGVIEWGLLLGLLLLVLGALVLVRSKSSANARSALILALVFLPMTSIYAGGALALANRTMDSAPAQVVAGKVAGKYVQRGKSSTHYYAQIVGTGSLIDGESLRVMGSDYARMTRGDDICVAIHPGQFGFRWAETVRCADAGRLP